MHQLSMAEAFQLIPRPTAIDPKRLVEDLRTTQTAVQPFDPRVLAFTADLSRYLRQQSNFRSFPAIGALAWWIRPAAIDVLQRHWRYLADVSGILRVPRGLVFHVPPTNVDTMFVYSWLLSALVGNANIIRLSRSVADAPSPLLGILSEVIADHPLVEATTSIVTYGHEETVTRELSQSDVRVIWGGDATITSIRAIPASPRCTEMVFPDRFSFTILDAETILKDEDGVIADLLAGFVRDAYLFDQLGCASPRLIVWRGTASVVKEAVERFRSALENEITARNEHATTSTVIAKLVHTSVSAADGIISSVDWSNNEAIIATLKDLSRIPRDSPGGGLFYQVRIDELGDLVSLIQRRDQTITHHGLTQTDLRDFIHKVGARGIDRVVPVGQALTFHHHWDGYDLLHSFSRSVQIESGMQQFSGIGTEVSN
jgi:hypothetical protein